MSSLGAVSADGVDDAQDHDIVIVPDSATVASAAATHTALTLAAVPVYAFTGVTRWVYQAASAVGAWFTTPEYDATKVEDAIDKLQSTLDFLDTKVGAMGGRVAKYATTAKHLYATKQVASAVHQLRLKKMYEREMAKMEALKFNIESNILHMESVGVMMETVSTIKETSHQFQVVSKHVDIARLEGSIEEMFEQRDTSRDIESILNEMHDTHEFDDDELLKELEATLADDGEGERVAAADDGAGVGCNAGYRWRRVPPRPTTVPPTVRTAVEPPSPSMRSSSPTFPPLPCVWRPNPLSPRTPVVRRRRSRCPLGPPSPPERWLGVRGRARGRRLSRPTQSNCESFVRASEPLCVRMSSSESSAASSFDDDQDPASAGGPKRVVKTFTSRLLSELIDFTLRSLGSLPCSIVFVVLVFMIDTALRSASAKLYFVCGYFIQLVFFYTFAVITFPKNAGGGGGEGEGDAAGGDEGADATEATAESAETKRMHDYLLQMVPFQQNTTASFYNFSVGYLLGYWGNINIQKNTRNATLVNSYYAAIVFFCFTFSVFYLKACSWQSGVVSVAF